MLLTKETKAQILKWFADLKHEFTNLENLTSQHIFYKKKYSEYWVLS
jgi:hypothetical protein